MDIADDTYVRVPPDRVAPVVADPASWRLWWPDLVPTVSADRGLAGHRWTVSGALRGSMEVWLEPLGGGTVVHWFLRADPAPPRSASSPRLLRRARERRVLAWKAHMFALKDRLETSGDVKDPTVAAESL